MKKKKKAGKLRAWECSYAYDVSHYVDFHVMARSEEEADRKITAAFLKGKFADVVGYINQDNVNNRRVFVMGDVKETSMPTMRKLTK